jgi:hypothetical protein
VVDVGTCKYTDWLQLSLGGAGNDTSAAKFSSIPTAFATQVPVEAKSMSGHVVVRTVNKHAKKMEFPVFDLVLSSSFTQVYF